jgi:hypothetical protein
MFPCIYTSVVHHVADLHKLARLIVMQFSEKGSSDCYKEAQPPWVTQLDFQVTSDSKPFAPVIPSSAPLPASLDGIPIELQLLALDQVSSEDMNALR